jgi:hypothetical protein
MDCMTIRSIRQTSSVAAVWAAEGDPKPRRLFPICFVCAGNMLDLR